MKQGNDREDGSPVPEDIRDYLRKEERKEILRFSTAGSVDDGKSTLIGRLLHDSKNIYEDQLTAIRGSAGSAGGAVDWALLTDGLKAEREQGITIDVAYRYFATPNRKFIIADTPGHEQYTRNMATGASTADLAVILVDARHGLRPQSKRHAFIASLLQIPHMVVAVNKMDLVGYRRETFEEIKAAFGDFATRLNVADIRFIPISALNGDNVVSRSDAMPWYRGESLLELLNGIHIASDRNMVDFRFPVQYVSRPDQNFRGYCGQIASGIVRQGDEVMALPSMKRSRVTEILTYDGPRETAFPPLSVTLRLADELDISRGDMLVHVHNRPQIGRHFEAMVVWMDEQPLDPATTYVLKHSSQSTRVSISEIRYKVDVNSLSRQPADRLALNEIGRLVLLTHQSIKYDPYERNRSTGSFILIDPVGNDTVAAGMIIDREPADQLPAKMETEKGTPASPRTHLSRIGDREREARMGQKPLTLWLTGLLSSGKTSMAYGLERRIFDRGGLASVLVGGQFRQGMSRALDFSSADRAEHLRRVAETARILNETGLIAICSFVSPDAGLRGQVADLIGRERFLEVFVDAPLDWCEARDRTGLYKKARAEKIRDLVGIHIPYEPPENPALHLRPDQTSEDGMIARIMELLENRGHFY